MKAVDDTAANVVENLIRELGDARKAVQRRAKFVGGRLQVVCLKKRLPREIVLKRVVSRLNRDAVQEHRRVLTDSTGQRQEQAARQGKRFHPIRYYVTGDA